MKKIALFVFVTALPTMASAQESNRFLGLDLSGALVTGSAVPGRPLDPDGWVTTFDGWGVDGNVRFLRPWFGVAGTFSRATGADYTLTQIAAGPRFTTPYVTHGFRGFTHGLVGVATMKSPGGSSDRSPVINLGGGFDFVYFGRFQIDYVRQDLPGVQKNDVRATLGAVVPLCLRSCRDHDRDGLNVRRK